MTPTARRGWTLVELCVTMAIAALLLCVALRMVFLTERAIRRETEGAGSARTALRLASNLAQDVRLAQRVTVEGGSRLTLMMSEGRTVRYAVDGKDTMRQERLVQYSFEGVVARFSTDGALLRATVMRETGETLGLAIHPRNLGRGEAL